MPLTTHQQLANPFSPGRDIEGVIRAIIGAAITVHKALGPGFLESVYENALSLELRRQGVRHSRQCDVKIHYAGEVVGVHRLDLLVEDVVVVELKTVRAFETRHFAVVRSYLRATGLKHGLLINFANGIVELKRVYPKAG